MPASTPRRRMAFRLALSVSTVLGSGLAAPAMAQLAAPAPVRQSVDGNGVDLFAGTINVDAPALTVGGEQGLSYHKLNRGGGWTDNVVATLNVVGSILTVGWGGSSDSFTVSSGTYTSTEGNGATLTLNTSTNVYTYTRADGTVMRFDRTRRATYPYFANEGRVLDITRPSGEKLEFSYEALTYCSSVKEGSAEPICMLRTTIHRLTSVRNSFGYHLGMQYEPTPDHDPEDPYWRPDFVSWATVLGVSAGNSAIAPGTTLASQNFSNTSAAMTITDALNRSTSYRSGAGGIVGIKRPGSTADDVVIAYSGTRVSSVTTAAGATTYAASDTGNTRTVAVTDPASRTTTFKFDIALRRMTEMADPLGRTAKWGYDASGRLIRATAPEGNYEETGYDIRGNVTSRKLVAKPGSGLANIETKAKFPDSCANAKICNSPIQTTDARGAVTDYDYDPLHGGVLTVTAPAGANGVEPQTRYGYTAFQPPAAGNIVHKVTSVSACRTAASCSGTVDETRTTIAYDPATLLPVSQTVAAGDGSVSATTTIGYDPVGNLTSVDGPVPGTGDSTRYYYDVLRRPTGVVGPDPDGAGVLRNRMVRIGYDVAGRQVTIENGISDSAGGNFFSAQTVTTAYDGVDRKTRETLTANNVVHALTQYGYNTAGQLECAAVRMNLTSTVLASLPGACALSTAGGDGPDRITRTTYDEAGRVVAVTSAYGTADQSNDQTVTYTPNGKPQWLGDANGNISTYNYDGHDRVARFMLPSKTHPGMGAGDTDYETYGYDANGNVVSRRLRDGQVIGYTYDALDRVTLKDVPNVTTQEYDITYAYDLLGNLERVQDANGHFAALRYDALGRKVSEQSNWTTRQWGYDAAGRMTRLTWGDGFYVTYDYDLMNRMTAVRENGAATLATLEYDNLGQRAWLRYPNQSSTAYLYDKAGRLDKQWLYFAGGSYDTSSTFTYNAASQIRTRQVGNDRYAWKGHYNVDRPYGVNGLNQLTSSGAVALGYDGRGNLSRSGSTAYGYTSENRLATAPGRVVAYDPLGRLHWVDQGLGLTWMQYDGDRLIEERDAGGVKRRYVWGPGVDEPLVWYEGSGTADKRWLHADERGSVVAVSNASGAVTAINTYDEHGIPGAANQGRFQYTGQKWMPELGLYDYKARMYSPTLGRFMQADPIGYGDGMNMYGYVGGDPVNRTDPSGLAEDIVVTGERLGRGNGFAGSLGHFGGFGGAFGTLQILSDPDIGEDIVVNGVRPRKPKPIQGKLPPIQPQKGCSAGGAAMRARLNALASNLGPVTYDSVNEVGLLAQYFRGDTTPYRLSGAEMAQARAYVGTYGNNVLGSQVRAGAGGTTERSIFFGKFASDAPLLDGLLGTATGIFRGGSLVGIRDTFNFDFKDRGRYPYGTFANAGVAMIRADAASCAGDVSIPITGG